jgi:hypothetical protein
MSSKREFVNFYFKKKEKKKGTGKKTKIIDKKRRK